MENKRKVLYYGDVPLASTGFSHVGKSILKRLYATGLYDIDIVGINYAGDYYNREQYPYQIYPAISPLSTNERARNDVYGLQKVISMAGSGKYDLIFILNDLFVIKAMYAPLLEVQKKLPKDRKFEIILYYPVDSPLKKEWVTEIVSKCSFPVTYTKYAVKETLKHDPNIANLRYLYHGTDKSIFFPFPKEDIPKLKMQMFGPEHCNKYIVLNVNRNQPRKDLIRTFMGFKLFHDKYPNTFLFILAQAHDVGGNLIDIAKGCGLEWDKDWACPAPGSYGASQGYPIEVVNKIYNASDVVVSSSTGEGWGLCLKSDTLVYSDTGVIKIADLNITNKVLSSDGDYHQVERILSRNYEGKLYKIKTWLANTPVESSADHPFYVFEDGKYVWKTAENLQIGDCLLFPKKYGVESPIVDTLEMLKPHLNSRQLKNIVEDGEYWKIQSNFKATENFIPRKIEITPEFCRLIGLFLSEGSNSITKKDCIRFSMNKNETKELDFISYMMRKYFGLPTHEMSTKSRGVAYQGRTIAFYSSVVSQLFSVWFGNGARNLRVPSLFLNLNSECIKELVYGMFLGDGSYTQTTFEFSICTTSSNLAYSLRLLFARLGIAASVLSSRTEYKIAISGLSKSRVLTLFGIPFSEPERTHAKEKTSANDDFIILPIKSIEVEEGTWRLIDIEVADTQDFVAGNVVVHNCSTEAMATMKPFLGAGNTSFLEIIGENEERGWFIKSGADLDHFICLGPGDNNQLRPVVDVYDMANKLEYIYTHPDEVRAKVERAYSEVWTWDDVCKEWIALFDKAWNKVQVMRSDLKQERNAPCACGSGKKAKNCCM